MKEETLKLIQLVNENKTLNEITSIMNLSKKQLFQKMTMLRQSGYLIEKKYYYNGDIRYNLGNPFIKKELNHLTIETKDNLSSIRVVSTSDSHYGNIKENLICRDKILDYCTKSGINLIFHLGDLFEGVIPERYAEQQYNNIQEQIQSVLSGYPLVDNILTLTLLGNHDASFWLDAGIDIKTLLEAKRHDIVPIGYEKGLVTINGFDFLLLHPIKRINTENIEMNKYRKILFHGHSHRFKIINHSSGLNIYVPSSSNLDNTINNKFLGTGIPSILDIEFIIKNNTITQAIINQYILYNNNLIKIGEFEEYMQILQPRNIEEIDNKKNIIKPTLYNCFTIPIRENDTDISNEEIIESKLKGTKHNKYRGLSQLDKFKTKYNQK